LNEVLFPNGVQIAPKNLMGQVGRCRNCRRQKNRAPMQGSRLDILDRFAVTGRSGRLCPPLVRSRIGPPRSPRDKALIVLY